MCQTSEMADSVDQRDNTSPAEHTSMIDTYFAPRMQVTQFLLLFCFLSAIGVVVDETSLLISIEVA